MDKEIMEQLLEQTLQKIGKTRAEFDKEVEELKDSSSIEVMGNLVSLMMESMDATANILSLVMLQNAELQKQIDELKGGNTNA
ncbi:hypothetical protein [Bacillus sp. Au-Bac7]|uniref:hypothetical protein n=1 Tax=Bacillus sp. Au-Bac7 TaxID=2906458 RepID=UPI001E4CAC9F|nr:hypothetical protein [Bacillus sp. Au-Bac7]MCE4048011.1 hypothetical protein [Bacillus sp. Au-Bac7]